MMIVAVVVTYNRKQRLLECMDALLGQTRPLDKIILIDNASTDGTPDLLKEKGYLDSGRLDYVRLPENTGGGGGFSFGIQRGCDAGYDWLWLMDDDAVPNKDALLTLLSSPHAEDAETGALLCSVRDGDLQLEARSTGAITRCEQVFNNRLLTIEEFDQSFLRVTTYPLLGVLVRTRVVLEVGNLRPEFFFQADDLDFTMRIAGKYKMWVVRDSILVHQVQKEQFASRYVPLLRKNKQFLAIGEQWKDYYGCRNYVYIVVRRTSIARTCRVLLSYMRTAASLFLFADYKWMRVLLYARAMLDGIAGNLGKRVDPVEWRRRLKS